MLFSNARPAMVLAIAVLVGCVPGCLDGSVGNGPGGEDYEKIDLGASWPTGIEWEYVDSAGMNAFVVQVIHDHLETDSGPIQLLSWNSGSAVDYETARLVATDLRGHGTASRWADPILVACVDPEDQEGCFAGGHRLGWVAFTDQVKSPLQIHASKPIVSSSTWSSQGFTGSGGGSYRGARVDYGAEIFARGPATFSSPYLGDIEVVEFRINFWTAYESPKFEKLADELALQGIDARNFTVTGEWGISERNYVHLVAEGGADSAQVFEAGFFVRGGLLTSREYWMTATQSQGLDNMDPVVIHHHWGGALPPSETEPYSLSLVGTIKRHFVIDDPPLQGLFIFSVDQGSHVVLPDEMVLEIQIVDGNGDIHASRKIKGSAFTRDAYSGLNRVSYIVDFDRPGPYAVEATLRDPASTSVAFARWNHTFDLVDSYAIQCQPVALGAATATCDALEIPAGPAETLNLAIEVTTVQDLPGKVDVVDGTGATVWSTEFVGSANTTLDPRGFDTTGPWTVRWTPPAATYDAHPRLDVEWRTTPATLQS